MLALHGFDAYGLEISARGAEAARQYVASELAEPSEANFGDASQWPKSDPGAAKAVAGDFFARGWEAECGGGAFDLVYDYTVRAPAAAVAMDSRPRQFLCALLPEMRKDWARRMGELLAPSGLLVCLEFPLYKDLAAAGPPWGLRGVYWNLLAQGGDGRVTGPPDETEAPAGQMRRLLYFKPARSYEAGRGHDMVSVWGSRRHAEP